MNLNICKECSYGCLKVTVLNNVPQTLTCSRRDVFHYIFVKSLSRELYNHILKNSKVFIKHEYGNTVDKFLEFNKKIKKIHPELMNIEFYDCPYEMEHLISDWNKNEY